MPTKIAPAINDSSAQALTRTFRTLNAGASYVLDAWPALYRATLARLAVAFTGAELALIVDAANGVLLTPEIAGQHAAAQLADACALEAAHERHGVTDWRGLVARVETLTPFERAALELWAAEFWLRVGEARREDVRNGVSLDEHVAQMHARFHR